MEDLDELFGNLFDSPKPSHTCHAMAVDPPNIRRNNLFNPDDPEDRRSNHYENDVSDLNVQSGRTFHEYLQTTRHTTLSCIIFPL